MSETILEALRGLVDDRECSSVTIARPWIDGDKITEVSVHGVARLDASRVANRLDAAGVRFGAGRVLVPVATYAWGLTGEAPGLRIVVYVNAPIGPSLGREDV